MNTPVSFSIAKLLKEKGFDELCSHAYKEVESPILYIHQDKKYNNSFKKEWQNTVRKNSNMNNATINRYSAPTIGEVVMWLYDNHRIYIHISPHGEEEDLLEDCKWWFSVYKNKLYNLVGGSKVTKGIEDFGSLTEAYEAAIKYTLNNLI